MFRALRHSLFMAIGGWLINRSQRTPYFHLTHADGSPYMNRYWLFKIGKAKKCESDDEHGPAFGIRVHWIRSSDERAFHDHPWNYTSVILRGGYTEVTPDWTHGPSASHVTLTDEYDGHEPGEYHYVTAKRFSAGDIIRRKADSWHYLTVADDGVGAWTLFITGRKIQDWGFLVDGLFKVPWRVYLAAKRKRAAAANRLPEEAIRA